MAPAVVSFPRTKAAWSLEDWQRHFLQTFPCTAELHGSALLITDLQHRIGFCTRGLGELSPEAFEAEARLTFKTLLELKEKRDDQRLPLGSSGVVPQDG